MKRLTIALIAALAATQAFAADIPTKAQATTVSVPVNWTGLYAYVQAGYLSKDEATNISANNALSAALIANGLVPSSVNVRPNGLGLGGGLGYDWQFGSVVAGAMVDWNYTDVYGSGTASSNLINRSVNERITNFGTVRGRLGYLVDPRMLVYVTGGGAWATVKTEATSSGLVCGFINCASGTSSNSMFGWVIGGGAEYRLDRSWSLGIEALYTQLGTNSTVLNGSIGKQPVSYTLNQDVNIGSVWTKLIKRF